MIVSSDILEIGNFAKKNKIYVALGYFDGVHLGHQALMAQCLQLARENQGEPCVLLLEPHPLQVLEGMEALKNLNSLTERISLIHRQGPFNIFVLPFTREFAALSPEEFVKQYLLELLQAKGVVTGFNYTFGSKGAGHCADLQAYGEKYGFMVRQVPPVLLKNEIVSSTMIRKLIEEGRMEKAAQYLGHPHVYLGKVVDGNHLGSLLGFPTANVDIDPQLLWPAYGVYGGWIMDEEGRLHKAVINVGIRPTIRQNNKRPSFEAHLLNFAGDLYDKRLQIILTDRLRPEQTFDDLTALKHQVARDKENALEYLNRIAKQAVTLGDPLEKCFFACNRSGYPI